MYSCHLDAFERANRNICPSLYVKAMTDVQNSTVTFVWCISFKYAHLHISLSLHFLQYFDLGFKKLAKDLSHQRWSSLVTIHLKSSSLFLSRLQLSSRGLLKCFLLPNRRSQSRKNGWMPVYEPMHRTPEKKTNWIAGRRHCRWLTM
jgi:hypothetical protein